jgi:hypothetical protein
MNQLAAGLNSIGHDRLLQVLRPVLCEGTCIMGATGTGKTKSSGKALAQDLLTGGGGGVVLTAKPDDLDTWVRTYFRNTGRDPREDVVVIGAEEPHPESIWPKDLLGPRKIFRYNVLQEEFERGGRLTGNIAQMLVAGLTHGMHSVSAQEPYWENALYQLLKNTIELAAQSSIAVSGRAVLRLEELIEIVQTAPQSRADLGSASWRKGRCFQLLSEVDRLRSKLQAGPFGDLKLAAAYWLQEFPSLADRTRSIIVSTLMTKADGLLRSPIRDLLFGESDAEASPRRCFEPDPMTGRARVIIVDLPVKLYRDVGRDAQLLYKLAWQREADRRAKQLLEAQGSGGLAFLWADEAHHFLTKEDALFQSTARSARIATCYLTQNLPNMYSAIGEHATHALLGSLQTKVFHTNGDPTTNDWAERLLGSAPLPESSLNVSYSDSNSLGGQFRTARQSVVPSIRYTKLRKAGPGNRAEAMVFHAGLSWGHAAANHVLTSFPPVDQSD